MCGKNLVIQYVEQKTGGKAVLSETGEEAHYNGKLEYSINTEVAEGLGFQFSSLKDWIYDLLDYDIREVEKERRLLDDSGNQER